MSIKESGARECDPGAAHQQPNVLREYLQPHGPASRGKPQQNDALRAQLAELGARFVCWRYEERNGKRTKVPRKAGRDRNASTRDRSTWADAETCQRYSQEKALIEGWGPVLGDLGDGWWLVGVDLDNALDVLGGMKPWAREIAERLNTYTEVSPSGTGLKAFGFVRGRPAINQMTRVFKKAEPGEEHNEQAEFIAGGRFFTLTGNLYAGFPSEIQDITDAFNTLVAEYWGSAEQVPEKDSSNRELPPLPDGWEDVSIDALLAQDPQLARAWENGEKLWTGGDGSGSAMDWALSVYLAHKRHDDATVVAALYSYPWGQFAHKLEGYDAERRARRILRDLQDVRDSIPPSPQEAFSVLDDSSDDNNNVVDFDAFVKTDKPPKPAWPEPFDLWGRFDAPELPCDALPPVIDAFAREKAEVMGADPAGLAMAALAVCSAALSDNVRLQVKANDPSWQETARLWVALVGRPSAKKSPTMKAAMAPLQRLSGKLERASEEAQSRYEDALAAHRKSKDPDEPKPERPKRKAKVLMDTTVEASQEYFADNPEGLLVFRDELAGWLGSIDRYNQAKGGASADRAFWLTAYDGGYFSVKRVSRKSARIDNLSASVLGGVQPSVIRKFASETVDDGLLQRFLVVQLRDGDVDRDDLPRPSSEHLYGDLVERLTKANAPLLHLSSEAQKVRQELRDEHHRLLKLHTLSPQLASHFGKADGVFARLCVLFHAADSLGSANPWPTDVGACVPAVAATTLPGEVTGDVARRVQRFMREFLRPHALSFYAEVQLTAEDEVMRDIGAYILAKGLTKVSPRQLAKATRKIRGLDGFEARKLLERLESLGWVASVESGRANSVSFQVNPTVHERFRERGERRKHELEAQHAVMMEAMGQHGKRSRS